MSEEKRPREHVDCCEPEAIRRTLIDWYRRHGRDLPWRRPGTSAWAVMVCEVMSQQTPISRVLPRWKEWMQRWPRVEDFAAAEVRDVLSAWDRLGYPRRALNLHRCAQVVVSEYDGVIPRDVEELRRLPGCGDYTASAVATFAYGEAVPVIDTNVRRVLARVLGGVAAPASSTRRVDRERAVVLMPPAPGGKDRLSGTVEDAVNDAVNGSVEWCSAIMEFGALHCVARTPKCDECVISQWCRWRHHGYPMLREGRQVPQAWHGTDRQLRGRVMAMLRAAHQRKQSVVSIEDAITAATDEHGDHARARRIIAALESDGLIEILDGAIAFPN